MPHGVTVDIDGDAAEVVFLTPQARAGHYADLLRADPGLRVDTGGRHRTYRTTAEAARAAGLVDEEKPKRRVRRAKAGEPAVEETPTTEGENGGGDS